MDCSNNYFIISHGFVYWLGFAKQACYFAGGLLPGCSHMASRAWVTWKLVQEASMFVLQSLLFSLHVDEGPLSLSLSEWPYIWCLPMIIPAIFFFYFTQNSISGLSQHQCTKAKFSAASLDSIQDGLYKGMTNGRCWLIVRSYLEANYPHLL